ncbi:MAG: AMP-dependent synthetase [Pelodictyon luteolum]|uniref:AMP-dependent synthetase n=1 Tax=Pelodictyon luteolum TaxID=1100 RepID=A0A165M668_PELLU|nr:AMP-binding protein [Pelodictyon luteolum]KZK74858.1 MAG: AMP-dependent synthetase [Pelodictyon luteolum]
MNAAYWTRGYDRGVPHSLYPYPEEGLVEVLRRAAAEAGDATALWFKGRSMTYGELERESDAFGRGLQDLGVCKGDRVALLLPNSPQMIIGEFGVWKTGAVVVPMNPLYSDTELEHAFRECGASAAVVLAPFYPKVAALRDRSPDGPLRLLIPTGIGEYLPPFTRMLFTLLKERSEGHRVAALKGDLPFQSVLQSGRHGGALPAPPDPDDTALFLFSGGTTGTPKCVVSTHRSLVTSGMQIVMWFSVILQRGSDPIMLNMPLFHVYGQAGIMTAALSGRHPMVLVPNPRDLDDLLSTIRRVRPSVLPGVPTLFTALIAHPRVKRDPGLLRSLKLCVSGAAPLLQETKERFESLTGGRIIDAYSLTEMTLAGTFSPILGTYKPGSVGIPLPDVEVKIVDEVSGDGPLGTNMVGEVLMRAPQMMRGYWQRPGESGKVLRDGWLLTGDIGYMDEDGYLFIVDRKKDVIKPGGFQVWPREVEAVIARHPAVLEVGVAGVQDPRQGEAVKAWVVLREGMRLDMEELREHCRKDLAAYKVPRFLECRESLPKSQIGKVLRRKLRGDD